MKYCFVPKCHRWKNVINPRFHVFPQDEARRKQWIHSLKLKREPTKHSVVCSSHFKLDDYNISNYGVFPGWLRKDAIPSLEPPPTSVDLKFKTTFKQGSLRLQKEHNSQRYSSHSEGDIKMEVQSAARVAELQETDENLQMSASMNVNVDTAEENSHTSFSNEDLKPMKSGEIFRNKLGTFSFVCTYCDVVCENCKEIMDHINLHFDKEHSIKQEPIEEASPEFISINELKPEPITLETKIEPNDVLQKPINAPIILKPKIRIPNTGGSGSHDKSLISHTSNISKIVKIVKLKRIKIRPRKIIKAGGNEMMSKVHQENSLTNRTDIPEINSQPEMNLFTQSEIKLECRESDEDTSASPAAHESDRKRCKYVHSEEMDKADLPNLPLLNRSKCCQCEMEPKIDDPSLPKRHICLFCATWFSTHLELETHNKEVHSKDTKGDGFNSFYCYVCKKTLSFPDNLVSHFKIHIVNTEHLCDTCGLKFNRFSSLKTHSEIHKERNLECEKCGKVFKRSDRLRNHMLCHNDELSFPCKICSKAFKLKKYLDRHMAVHNDVRINCRYCDASFNFATVRRAHEKSRHNVM